MNRATKNTLKRSLLRLHRVGTRLGVTIIPSHYYSCVPNVLDLERTRKVWSRRSEMPGIRVDLDEQAAALREFCSPYQREFAGNPYYKEGVANHFGPGYGYVEAQCLHGVVRHLKPARIVEVGSGVSTFCMSKAVELNQREGGRASQITSIEPYPSGALRRMKGITLVPSPVQTCGLDPFLALEGGDLLFIDSSHTVKPGGDVNFLFLEVLPRLRPGVLVHVHDINLPYDYQHNLMQTMLFWSEGTLLQAYLAHNSRAAIKFCLSMIHYDRPGVLKEVFPEYHAEKTVDGLRDAGLQAFDANEGHFPSSIYIETK